MARPERQPGADEHGVVAEFRRRRGYPLFGTYPIPSTPSQPGRDAAAGAVLDRLERAERTTLSEASVQEDQWHVGGLERTRVRKMCSAVFRGVHKAEALTGVSRGKVACGVTNPGGNNHPRGRRPAPTPIPFVRAMRAGKPTFDVYAHHPYPGSPSESPSEPPSVKARITLGNLGVLIRELNRLGWSTKRVWLTEYGYQTKPPDGLFGVTPTNQAAYMRQAYRSRNRIAVSICSSGFCSRTSSRSTRWQSGLIWSGGTREGLKKPSYLAFKALRG